MATNKVQLRVQIVNPDDSVVITKNCPHSSEVERIAYGQSLAVEMFTIGVYKQLSPSELRAFPPHRIKDILIVSS